jgi:hypothetical protein
VRTCRRKHDQSEQYTFLINDKTVH